MSISNLLDWRRNKQGVTTPAQQTTRLDGIRDPDVTMPLPSITDTNQAEVIPNEPTPSQVPKYIGYGIALVIGTLGLFVAGTKLGLIGTQKGPSTEWDAPQLAPSAQAQPQAVQSVPPPSPASTAASPDATVATPSYDLAVDPSRMAASTQDSRNDTRSGEIAEVAKKVQALEKQLVDFQMRLAKVEHRTEAKTRASVRHTRPAATSSKLRIDHGMKLHAIVPGQAWVDEGNKVVIVQKGDGLNKCGRVVRIDAEGGVVTTQRCRIGAF